MNPTNDVRRGGRLTGMAWLTWRQHRSLLAVSTVLAGGFAGYLLVRSGELAASPEAMSGATLLLFLTSIPTGVIAVFWAAPLLAREYEHGTHRWVWTQEVSRTRWLVTKTTLLAAVAIGLSAGLGVAANRLADRAHALEPRSAAFGPLESSVFESRWPMQVCYAVFGIALGLAVSSLARRTVLSMGITLVSFIVTRTVIAIGIRPSYLPPLRIVTPIGAGSPLDLATDVLDFGYLDAAGDPVSFPAECGQVYDQVRHLACQRAHGLAGMFETYQPASRAPVFHMIELGIYATLTAILVAVAWLRVRRSSD